MDRLTFNGKMLPEYKSIYSDDANAFVAMLAEEFAPRVGELLEARKARQAEIDAGELPDFLPATKAIREGDWSILGVPSDLRDRRVEITGPVDRKMIINALNANVKVFMADFEDSLSPTWEKVAQGQINMRDAVNGTITLDDPKTDKHYELNEDPAVLICRVRGLHLPEKHIHIYDQEIPGGLIDFAYYFFHNYKALLTKGSGPYFYIPKLQSHNEARWWADLMDKAEDLVGLERGTIKATVLIETLPAVFEMDEILHELRNHIVALNCGRWDYIFSYIKTLKNYPDRVLPDRQVVTMNKPFLSAYSRLLIKTCHKRGALAMGGMAAFIPRKDPEANAAILKRVVDDKTIEAQNGHDGTWVAHPGLANTAMAVLDEHIGEGNSNQMSVSRANDADITAVDLLEACEGDRTEKGMRTNLRIAVQYIEAWIQGNGCVPIYGLMEDAATAEISRSSIWQWIHHGKKLSNGKKVTVELFRELMIEEMETIKTEVGEERFIVGRFDEAVKIMDHLTTSEQLVDFLTITAYEYL